MRTHFRPDPGATSENVTAARVAELRTSDSPEHCRELRVLADSFVAEYEFQDCDWNAIREAIAVNPSCSSHLWDIAGDCLLELGQPHEARKALLRAIEINPEDVRARFGLASVHIATKDWNAALETIANGLACSRDPKWTSCCLIKRSVFDKIGGTFPKSALGIAEVELGRSVRSAGYKIACCQDLFIHHSATRTPVRRS